MIQKRRAADQRPFFLELPGIEPAALPGDMHYELQLRSVSFRFGPAHYLRFRFES
jgi:hypothetical protein